MVNERDSGDDNDGGDNDDDEYSYAVKQTYLYLRLSLVGTIVAIGIAVAYALAELLSNGRDPLPSISHYYYTPARIVFVGALCAAALALLTLAGKGVQSYLLDIAALLAPLIALLPTPVELEQVATFDPKCAVPSKSCIPPADFEYVRLGFKVWLWMAGIVILIALVRAILRPVLAKRDLDSPKPVPRSYWVTLIVASVIWVILWATGNWAQTWFHSKAHFYIAGAFFLLVSIVAWIEARIQWRLPPRVKGEPVDTKHGSKGFAAVYLIIAILLGIVIVGAAIVIIIQNCVDPNFWPIGVFVVEAAGLILFAVFFALQTWHHRRDGDGWGPLPPSTKRV